MAKVVAPVTEARSKQQLAYDYLKAGIDRGLYAPKQRLVIDTLAKELSISPVPVREAIRRLEAEGLIIFSKTPAQSWLEPIRISGLSRWNFWHCLRAT